MGSKRDEYFVNDGAERAAAAVVAQIRADVEVDYAERLKAATWFEQLLIRGEMRREIKRRLASSEQLDRVSSPYNLYLST